MLPTDRFVLAGIGGALLLAGAAGWMLLAPGTSTPDPSPDPAAMVGSDDPFSSEGAWPSASPELVIDVEGGGDLRTPRRYRHTGGQGVLGCQRQEGRSEDGIHPGREHRHVLP